MLDTLEEDLSEEVIKHFHHELKSGVFEDRANGYAIGEYKKRANMVGMYKTALPNEVAEEMAKLLEWYNMQEKSLHIKVYWRVDGISGKTKNRQNSIINGKRSRRVLSAMQIFYGIIWWYKGQKVRTRSCLQDKNSDLLTVMLAVLLSEEHLMITGDWKIQQENRTKNSGLLSVR